MAKREQLGHCNTCDKQLTSWDLRCSKALAHRFPICERCIAKEYEMETDELRDLITERSRIPFVEVMTNEAS